MDIKPEMKLETRNYKKEQKLEIILKQNKKTRKDEK